MKVNGSAGQYRYPESRRTDHVDIIHDVKVPDPYRWLEEIDSEVLKLQDLIEGLGKYA